MPDQPTPLDPLPPTAPAMAARLAVNRAGRLTPGQRRLAWIVGGGALAILLCPLAIVIQLAAVIASGDAPMPTFGGLFFTVLGVGFAILFAGLIGPNAAHFLPEAWGRQPVRYARGPLHIHVSEGHRPELPFSYIVDGYSFAPYIVPPDLPMRPGAPYLIYYARRSRLLLSIVALDAPDAVQWEPQFDNPPPYNWH